LDLSMTTPAPYIFHIITFTKPLLCLLLLLPLPLFPVLLNHRVSHLRLQGIYQ
jgi:hypothetical protein